jgi:hypothetical protein
VRVVINPQTEPVKLATKLDYHREKPPSTQTITRWILKGMRAVDGRLVKLDALKIGYQWHSSQDAVERLIVAVNTPADAPLSKTPSQRAAQNEAAKRILEKAGV